MEQDETPAQAQPKTEQAVLEMLREACAAAGSQSAWAAQNGISGPYVTDVLRRNRAPGDSVLRCLGLKKAPALYIPRDEVVS
ncbi:hypothetical protein ACLBWX_18385 [Methylobacterium sp. M6A4_1b]